MSEECDICIGSFSAEGYRVEVYKSSRKERTEEDGWVPSEKYPNHLTKTLVHGNATIHVHAPILTEEEQNKRLMEVARAMLPLTLAYERRKRMNEENTTPD